MNKISAGSIKRSCLSIPGSEYSLPYTIIKGRTDGPKLLVLSGIHGVEYLGIAASRELVRLIDPADLKGSLQIIHLANPAGFYQRREYINPEDGKNLGSVFPGSAEGSSSERIAERLMSLMEDSDFLLDLHAGDAHEALTPFSVISARNPETEAASLALARAVGLPYIASLPHPGMPIAAAAEAGIPAVMLEIGGQAQWDRSAACGYAQRLVNALKAVGSLDGEPEKAETHLLKTYISVKSTQQGCWLPAVNAGETLQKGQKIGQLEDIHGQLLQEYHAEEAGVLLYIISALAVQEHGSLFAIGVL